MSASKEFEEGSSSGSVDEFKETQPEQLEETNKFRLELREILKKSVLCEETENNTENDNDSQTVRFPANFKRKLGNIIRSSSSSNSSEEGKLFPSPSSSAAMKTVQPSSKKQKTTFSRRKQIKNPFVISQAQKEVDESEDSTDCEEVEASNSAGIVTSSFIKDDDAYNSENRGNVLSEQAMYLRLNKQASSSRLFLNPKIFDFDENNEDTDDKASDHPNVIPQKRTKASDNDDTRYDSAFVVANDQVEYSEIGNFTQAMNKAQMDLTKNAANMGKSGAKITTGPCTRHKSRQLKNKTEAEEMLGHLGKIKQMNRTVAACMNNDNSSGEENCTFEKECASDSD